MVDVALTAVKTDHSGKDLTGFDLPRRVLVTKVIQSRYGEHANCITRRPLHWEERCAGSEIVQTEKDGEILLVSSGGQSTPAPGWEILLTKQIRATDGGSGFAWTLYGVKPAPKL